MITEEKLNRRISLALIAAAVTLFLSTPIIHTVLAVINTDGAMTYHVNTEGKGRP